MSNIIKILWSKVAGHVPAVLVDGRIAINQKDKVLFYPDENNVVQQMSLIPAAGSVSVSTVEVDLGLPALNSGSFNITGLSGLTPGKQVVITQACGPYTGKGTLEDESEMDLVTAKGYVVDATTIKCFWNSQYKVLGNFKFNYFIQN